jgi:hypothetical protein
MIGQDMRLVFSISIFEIKDVFPNNTFLIEGCYLSFL